MTRLRLAASSMAGLLLAAACSAAATPPAPRPRTVDVRIHHSRFIPASFIVSPGATVTFVIRNTDPIDHEFILGDGAVQASHEKGTEQTHGEVPGEVTVPAGSTGSTTFTFPNPGKLVYACHLPGHFDYGMRGVVTVR